MTAEGLTPKQGLTSRCSDMAVTSKISRAQKIKILFSLPPTGNTTSKLSQFLHLLPVTPQTYRSSF